MRAAWPSAIACAGTMLHPSLFRETRGQWLNDRGTQDVITPSPPSPDCREGFHTKCGGVCFHDKNDHFPGKSHTSHPPTHSPARRLPLSCPTLFFVLFLFLLFCFVFVFVFLIFLSLLQTCGTCQTFTCCPKCSPSVLRSCEVRFRFTTALAGSLFYFLLRIIIG